LVLADCPNKRSSDSDIVVCYHIIGHRTRKNSEKQLASLNLEVGEEKKEGQ